jgi:hypothetical protein
MEHMLKRSGKFLLLFLTTLVCVASIPTQALAQAQQVGLTVVDASLTASYSNNVQWGVRARISDRTTLPSESINSFPAAGTARISITRFPTKNKLIFLTGKLKISNTGSVAADIGNIVVDLQRMDSPGKNWVSAAADCTTRVFSRVCNVVAAATQETPGPDFSISGPVGTFIHTPGSGCLACLPLDLIDLATNSSAFGFGATLPAGETREYSFRAAFDNELMNIPDLDKSGRPTPLRAEVLLTLGNAGVRDGNPSAMNIDMDSTGTIDDDEQYVRTIAARFGFSMPTLETQERNRYVSLTAYFTLGNPTGGAAVQPQNQFVGVIDGDTVAPNTIVTRDVPWSVVCVSQCPAFLGISVFPDLRSVDDPSHHATFGGQTQTGGEFILD